MNKQVTALIQLTPGMDGKLYNATQAPRSIFNCPRNQTLRDITDKVKYPLALEPMDNRAMYMGYGHDVVHIWRR